MYTYCEIVKIGELRDRAKETPVLISFEKEEYLIYMSPYSHPCGVASRPDGTDFIELNENSLGVEVYVVDEFNLVSDLIAYAIFESKL